MATAEKDEGSFFHYKGKEMPVDADGHLVNLDDWSEELALPLPMPRV